MVEVESDYTGVEKKEEVYKGETSKFDEWNAAAVYATRLDIAQQLQRVAKQRFVTLEKRRETNALCDTGANISLLRNDVCEKLGLDKIRLQKQRDVGGIAGSIQILFYTYIEVNYRGVEIQIACLLVDRIGN